MNGEWFIIHRRPIDVPQISLFSSMLALIPQGGNFSLCLGRLGLPDRLPFSKPKVNWLLHTRSAFRRTPSGHETYNWFLTNSTHFSYTKGIPRVYKRQASFPYYTKNAANMQFIAKTFGHIKYFHYLCSRKFIKTYWIAE